ncbi:MAG: hypothetical protein VX794_03315 [Nitrospinota bacterium]|nr:hypothetical protein [Nitrospinota bacterium]
MAKITKSGSRKGSRKKMHVKKKKSQHNRRKKIRGGAPGVDSNKDFKPIGGIMYWIKNTIATKVSYILNSQVTRRVEDYFLNSIPPEVSFIEERLRQKIDDVANKIVSDMTMKGLSVAENGVKAVPGIGNALSVFVMVDKAIAGVRNVANAVNKIAEDVANTKFEMLQNGVPREIVDKLPDLPTAPTSLGEVLPASAMQQLNKVPGLGNQQGPAVSVPQIPTAPNMPQVPQMSQMPNVPNMQQMPQMPQMPQIPTAPNMQEMQNQMTQNVNNQVNQLAQRGGKKSRNQRDKILYRTNQTIKRFRNGQLGGTRRLLLPG